jgi:hypothetical protein
MAALLITDEFWDMRERLHEIESGAAEGKRTSAVSL